MKKIDVVLGAGLEGYGVVRYAIDISRVLLDKGYDVKLCYPEAVGKYERRDTYSYSDIPNGHQRDDAQNIVVSLPVTEDQFKEFIDKRSLDNAVVISVNRNFSKVKDTLGKLGDSVLGVKAWIGINDTAFTQLPEMFSNIEHKTMHCMIANREISYAGSNGIYKKLKLMSFAGRPADYKSYKMSLDLFDRKMVSKNWSYAHLSDIPNEDVLRTFEKSSLAFYGSYDVDTDDTSRPIVEYTLLEAISRRCMIVVPDEDYRRRLLCILGIDDSRSVVSIENLDINNIDAGDFDENLVKSLEMFSGDRFYDNVKEYIA